MIKYWNCTADIIINGTFIQRVELNFPNSIWTLFKPLTIYKFHKYQLMTNWVIVLSIVGNILSVVGCVITNKYITEVDGYDFMIFLSFLHFAFTTIGTRVMLGMGYFTYTPAPLNGILPVAIGSLLSVAFMNLNLSTNSVGFYQVTLFFPCSCNV